MSPPSTQSSLGSPSARAGRCLEETSLFADVSDLVPQLTSAFVPSNKYEPIQALILLTGNKLDTLGRLHVEALDELKPVIKYRSPNHIIPRTDIDASPPTGGESIEGTALSINVPAQIALKILDTDMDEHVHSFHRGKLLQHGKREISQVKGIEEGKMQPIGVKHLHNRLGCFGRGPDENICVDATRYQTVTGRLHECRFPVGEEHLRKWCATLHPSIRRDERAPVDHAIGVTNPGAARTAEEINVRCSR